MQSHRSREALDSFSPPSEMTMIAFGPIGRGGPHEELVDCELQRIEQVRAVARVVCGDFGRDGGIASRHDRLS